MKDTATVAITLKTPEQIERMRKAGRIVRLVLDRLGRMVAPGVTTEELNRQAEAFCDAQGAECLFKGVRGRYGAAPFPGAICVSINEQVVHGIPGRRVIADGDIVSVDFGVRLDGWCADAAETYVVGSVGKDTRRLVEVTNRALWKAIERVSPGRMWSEVARAVQGYVEGQGFSVVREFVGHGIGSSMHEEPQIPNFVSRELLADDIELREGMTLAIEPMVNMGSPAVECASDGWTVRTKDRMPSAHFEHTVAVTAGGAAVLTDGS